MSVDTSRDPAHLHPLLRERWEWMAQEWPKRHPTLPKPFLTATYRGPVDQGKALSEGKSRTPFGQSLHNFKPAYAFDVAFPGIGRGALDWSPHLFQKWGELGEKVGLEWGGRWPELVDGPHLQLPMTVDMARKGEVPALPELEGPDTRRKVVFMRDGRTLVAIAMQDDDDVVVRYSEKRNRTYVDVRKEG